MRISRRSMLAGATSSLATTAFAQAPLTSLRPVARTPDAEVVTKLVAKSGVSGATGLVVMDLSSGAYLEQIAQDLPRPPASVTKAFTALYAIESLGGDHRFETLVFADGPINDGILNGNLILVGGGDPNLVTDQIAALAQSLKDTGLIEVKGDFLVWDNALTNLDEIDDDQLDYLGYNPTITGLNLNYNRVYFEWKADGNDFVTTMDARSEKYRPAVTTARMQIVDRVDPVFTYRDAGDFDQWTVARRALNAQGSRWLPSRHPALYAGEVFATFMRSHGVLLKPPKEVADTPNGTPVARYQSMPLNQMMRGMLRFSTNITAEAAGMSATAALTGQKRGLRTSAFGMARWADIRAGGISPQFVDHSGLGDQSRVTAGDMVRLLAADGVKQTLHPILRNIVVSGDDQELIANGAAAVRAKTGTLNFVSTLAGYVQTAKGSDLAFAIFSADLDARAQGKLQGDENPPGARPWNRRARALQQDVLRHLVLRV